MSNTKITERYSERTDQHAVSVYGDGEIMVEVVADGSLLTPAQCRALAETLVYAANLVDPVGARRQSRLASAAYRAASERLATLPGESHRQVLSFASICRRLLDDGRVDDESRHRFREIATRQVRRMVTEAGEDMDAMIAAWRVVSS